VAPRLLNHLPTMPRLPFPPPRRHYPALMALVAGLVLSLCAAWIAHQLQQRSLYKTLGQVAQDRVDVLKGQLIRSMEVLESITSLYAVNPHVTRTQFGQFVRGALARQPEVQALAWDARVPGSERAEWEARAQADGFPAFQFTEENGKGVMVRAAVRDEYFPVYFLETLERNKAALGFDVGSEAHRRPALEMARDSGRATATGPLRLAQEPGSQNGFLVFQPIYEGPAGNVAQRRASLIGFAVAVFRVGDLVMASLQPAIDRGINVSIRDQAGGSEIYRQEAGPAGNLPAWMTPIEVAGRTWSIRFQATPKFAEAGFDWQAALVFAAGLLITALISAYFFDQASHLAATQKRVEEATQDLSLEISERKKIEAALRTARDGLERRVAERTTELAASNEALQVEVATRKQAEAEAAGANRAKSEFLANMSHEIRTPLNAILGYTHILLSGSGLHPFQRDAMGTIASSSNHLLRLINEILDLSKIDAGRMEVTVGDLDLVEVARELESMFQLSCEEKRLGLCVEGLEGIEHAPVRGDEGKLRQVLINLLSNAVKFTEAGRVTLAIHRSEEDSWHFEIRDTGPGIAPERQPLIFKPFMQGENASRLGGTGLGLTIARRQVELMGGKLEVESTVGEGSRFFFTLELPPGSPSRPGSAKSNAQVERLAPGSSVRALVVDDIRENREVLSVMLDMIGCEVILAENGRQAIEAARVSRPDIIFMDMRLPEIDGLEATRRLIEEWGPRGPKIVATSASVLAHEQAGYLDAGCHDFAGKPFSAGRIYDSLQRLLGVDFIYKATLETEEEPPIDFNEIALPEDLISRMVMAAELHSTTVLKACLKELDAYGPHERRLAEHLRGFLRSYDLETIQRLIAQLPSENLTVSSSSSL
jgi:signal transduction histidine kinase/CheY-like chemotaxis protein